MSELEAKPAGSPLDEIGKLADIPVALEVELDRRVMKVRDILELDVGSIVKLTRSAGENIDILVDGTLVGFGEIVIIEDAMGIRVTDFKSDD
ncbi:MAG: FliM/FliN family flagellar motor switch protein [Bryobacteraceae bacterium]|jgi:flagellar motor switch protein FliN/FliY